MGEPGLGPALTPAEGAALVRLVLAGIVAHLAERPLDGRLPEHAVLRALGACFVTLENRGRLRGCVGTLDAARPLYLDALQNARRAMHDPRMPAVSNVDLPDLDVKVSVLSAPQRLAVHSRRDLVRQLRPGVDGLVFAGDGRRATFLPAVWAKLAEPDRFVAALLRKGGWAASGWPPELRVSRYTCVEFADHAPR